MSNDMAITTSYKKTYRPLSYYGTNTTAVDNWIENEAKKLLDSRGLSETYLLEDFDPNKKPVREDPPGTERKIDKEMSEVQKFEAEKWNMQLYNARCSANETFEKATREHLRKTSAQKQAITFLEDLIPEGDKTVLAQKKLQTVSEFFKFLRERHASGETSTTWTKVVMSLHRINRPLEAKPKAIAAFSVEVDKLVALIDMVVTELLEDVPAAEKPLSEKTLKKAFKVFVTHIITSALPTYGDLGTINGKLRLPDTDTSAPKTLVEIAQLLNNLVARHGQKVDYENNGEGSSKGSVAKKAKSSAGNTQSKRKRGNLPDEIGGPRPDDGELTCPGHRKPVEHTWAECRDKKNPWVKENFSKYMEEFRAKRAKKAGAKGGDDGKDVDTKVSMKVGDLVEASAAIAKAKRARLEEVQELDSG
ncbi:hypothetical protein HDV05_002094, partial [Chytridiales sp. JEL 0842]